MKVLILAIIIIIGLTVADVPPEKSIQRPNTLKKNYSLKDDFYDFLALIPIGEMLIIMEEHFQSDGALCEVSDSLHTEEVRDIMDAVRSNYGVKKLILYLQLAGVPDDFRELNNDFWDLLYENDDCSRGCGVEASLKPLLWDLMTVYPYEEFKALLEYKLENSIEFYQFIEYLKMEEFHALIREIIVLAPVQTCIGLLKGWDIPIDRMLEKICEFFNWEPCDLCIRT